MFDRRLRSTARPFARATRRIADRIDRRAVHRRIARSPIVPTGWTIESVRRARSDVRIVRLRGPAGEPAILKLAAGPDGAERLARERSRLVDVRTRIPDPELRQLVPEPLAAGIHDGWAYLTQAGLPGVNGTSVLADEPARLRVVAASSDVIGRIHQLTGSRRAFSDEELTALVDRPLEVVAGLLGRPDGRLSRLREDLRRDVEGRELLGGAVHGDLWLENVLVDPSDHRVLGIVDWDSAELEGLALHDQLHLQLYTRKLVGRSEIGHEICREAARVGRDADAAASHEPPGSWSGLRPRTELALYWLRLVQLNLVRQPRQTRRHAWVEANVREVLGCL